MIVDYIDAHKADYGVEPICRALVQVAPSTYYAAKSRPPSARAVRDAELIPEIQRMHAENYGVYGARKVNAERNRQGIRVARCTVERLRCRRPTRSHADEEPADHDTGRRNQVSCGPGRAPVSRGGAGPAVGCRHHLRPHIRRVGVRRIRHPTCSLRRVVGWQLSTSLRTDLALDALEMGIWARTRNGQAIDQLIHPSDRGSVHRSNFR
ncbi:IS3 family transposase [Rhodococcus sp. WAY2]|uniref:IS3 family transposase n=1 Tax=Rhodococcus sp. WAY2 TaxID=2663121 RepID=UPI00135A55AC